MKCLPFGLLLLFAWVSLTAQSKSSLTAQTKYFEGELHYQITVHSRQDGLSDQDVSKMLGTGPMVTVYMKGGNCRRNGIREDEYYRGADKKVYIKFAKLDTLYWMDYSADTSVLTGVIKSDSIFTVDQYPCKVITVNTSTISRRYYYSPDLKKDPRVDSGNSIGHFDVYNRETGGSIYLWSRINYQLAVVTDSCVQVVTKAIDDHVFDLPTLPQKKFAIESLVTRARFPGKPNSWLEYLQGNLDTKLAAKYVKLPKGQDEANETVFVSFIVNESGLISDITVMNRDQVHPKLAAEAERVIRESPRWLPTIWYGEKVSALIRQPIIFQVRR